MRLDELEIGQKAKIQKLTGKESYKSYFYDMGFLPGEEIKILRRAPMGGLFLVGIMDYQLCIRKDGAAAIQVQKIDNAERML